MSEIIGRNQDLGYRMKKAVKFFDVFNAYLMKIMKTYRLLFMLLFVIQSLMGQEIAYEEFTDRDGLPSMQTYQIDQDSSGLLWIGTENGLVRASRSSLINLNHIVHCSKHVKMEITMIDGSIVVIGERRKAIFKEIFETK